MSKNWCTKGARESFEWDPGLWRLYLCVIASWISPKFSSNLRSHSRDLVISFESYILFLLFTLARSVCRWLCNLFDTHNARHGFAQWTASKYHWRNSSPFSTGMGAHVLLVMIIRPNMPSHMPKRSSAGFVHEGSLALPHGPLCFWYLSSKFDHVHWKEPPMGPKVRSADFAGSNSQILTSERSNYCSG